MLNKYKPKPDSPRAIDSTPQTRTLPASTQSAGPLRDTTIAPSNQPQTAPVERTKSFNTASPIPFNSFAEQEPVVDKPSTHSEKNVTPITNRRASVSAVASPYNLISLNTSFGMPALREDEEFSAPLSSPTPAALLTPKSQTPPYPNTPAYSFATPSPSTTRTPWPSVSRRASSPSRINSSYGESPLPESATVSRTRQPTPPSLSTPMPTSSPRTPSPEPSLRPNNKSPSRAHSPEHSHAVRILVADNSSNDRHIYTKMLAQYQADIVGSGIGALDLFDTNNYDVILLDCNLEGKCLRMLAYLKLLIIIL